MPMANASEKAQKVESVVAKTKSTRASCSSGVCGQDAVEQGRQRHVDDEEVHPAQRRVRYLLDLAADEANEDQPEKRRGEIENVEHPGKSRSRRRGNAPTTTPTWRGLCIPLNGRLPFWRPA